MIPPRLVLATANPGKARELAALVAAWGQIEVLDLGRFPAVRLPPEDGATYDINAAAKARAVAAATGLPALGDDSGLEVDALDGAPGIRSARYAPTDHERIAKLLGALAGVPAGGRGARFRCVVALAWPGGPIVTAEGVCAGEIASAPSGAHGFGYDPIFRPAGHTEPFAALPAAVKDEASHRARAVRALGRQLAAAK